jgi:hypothetical protein
MGEASRRDGRVRTAITGLLDHAQHSGCGAAVVENLDFADARATGRETLGRGQRGKRLRRTIAGIPTRKFGTRLTGMATRRGIGLNRPKPAAGAPSTGENPCNNKLPNRSPGTTPRRSRSARGLGLAIRRRPAGPRTRQGTSTGTPPATPDPQPSTTPRRCRSSGPPTPPRRGAGPPENTHRQRPRPFGPHRTHSCSVNRNGHSRIGARETVTASSMSGSTSTPIPGPVGTLRWPSSSTNGAVRSVV